MYTNSIELVPRFGLLPSPGFVYRREGSLVIIFIFLKDQNSRHELDDFMRT